MPDADPIAELAAQGLTAIEIAVRLGLTHKQVLTRAHRSGFRFPRGGVRRIGTDLPRSSYAALKDLAERAAVPPSTMLNRIVSVAFEEGVAAAARRLGKMARPKRAYVRRQEA